MAHYSNSTLCCASEEKTIRNASLESNGFDHLDEKNLLDKLNYLITGIPPPPSLTTCKMSCTQMIENYQQNKSFFLDFPCSGKVKNNLENPKVFYLNSGDFSEKIAEMTLKLQARFVQSETASTCMLYDCERPLTKSAQKRRQCKGLSPGSRLSHLARRRHVFSRANLQQMSQNEVKTGRIAIKTQVNSQRNLAKEYLDQKQAKVNSGNLPKRALFQSPDEAPVRPGFRTVVKPVPRRRLFSNADKEPLQALPPGGGGYDVSQWLASQPFVGGRKRAREESRDRDRKRRCPRRSLDFSDGSPSVCSELSSKSSCTPAIPATPALSQLHRQKLLWAVAMALKEKKILHKDPIFKSCATTLYNICKNNMTIIQNLQITGGTSEKMLTYARQQVSAVLDSLQSKEPKQKNTVLHDVTESTLNQKPVRAEVHLAGKENTPKRKIKNRNWRTCLKSNRKSRVRLYRSHSSENLELQRLEIPAITCVEKRKRLEFSMESDVSKSSFNESKEANLSGGLHNESNYECIKETPEKLTTEIDCIPASIEDNTIVAFPALVKKNSAHEERLTARSPDLFDFAEESFLSVNKEPEGEESVFEPSFSNEINQELAELEVQNSQVYEVLVLEEENSLQHLFINDSVNYLFKPIDTENHLAVDETTQVISVEDFTDAEKENLTDAKVISCEQNQDDSSFKNSELEIQIEDNEKSADEVDNVSIEESCNENSVENLKLIERSQEFEKIKNVPEVETEREVDENNLESESLVDVAVKENAIAVGEKDTFVKDSIVEPVFSFNENEMSLNESKIDTTENSSSNGEICTSTPINSFTNKLLIKKKPAWKIEAGPGLKIRVRLSKEWDIVDRNLAPESAVQSTENYETEKSCQEESEIAISNNTPIETEMESPTMKRAFQSTENYEAENSCHEESEIVINNNTPIKTEIERPVVKRSFSIDSTGTSIENYTLKELKDHLAIGKSDGSHIDINNKTLNISIANSIVKRNISIDSTATSIENYTLKELKDLIDNGKNNDKTDFDLNNSHVNTKFANSLLKRAISVDSSGTSIEGCTLKELKDRMAIDKNYTTESENDVISPLDAKFSNPLLKRVVSIDSSGTSMESYTLMEMKDRIDIERTLERETSEISFFDSETSINENFSDTSPNEDEFETSLDESEVLKIVEVSEEVIIPCHRKLVEQTEECGEEVENKSVNLDDIESSDTSSDDETPLLHWMSRTKKNCSPSNKEEKSCSELLFSDNEAKSCSVENIPIAEEKIETAYSACSDTPGDASPSTYCDPSSRTSTELSTGNTSRQDSPSAAKNVVSPNESDNDDDVPLSQLLISESSKKTENSHLSKSDVTNSEQEHSSSLNSENLQMSNQSQCLKEAPGESTYFSEIRYFKEISNLNNSEPAQNDIPLPKENGDRQVPQANEDITTEKSHKESLFAEASSSPKSDKLSFIEFTKSSEKIKPKLTLESYRSRRMSSIDSVESSENSDKSKKIYNIRLKKRKKHRNHHRSIESSSSLDESKNELSFEEKSKIVLDHLTPALSTVEEKLKLLEGTSNNEDNDNERREALAMKSEILNLLKQFLGRILPPK